MRESVTRRNLLRAALGGTISAAPRSNAAVPQFRRGGMLYRRLGQTDLYPSVLSFGSHTDPAYKLPGPRGTVLNEAGQARRDRQVAHAFDLGINMLDIYEKDGQWEASARVMRPRRDKVLASLCLTVDEPIGVNIDRAARLFGHSDMYRFHTAAIDGAALENWDTLRKAKEAGKVRAIGISTHVEDTMLRAVEELEGIDYVFFPYNFIHARAEYTRFLPEAIRKGVGLIAMKPVAAGSIVRLDPRARPGVKPETEAIQLYQGRYRPILPAAVAELTKSLDRLPDETLCQAAMRFVYSKDFITCAITGMFDDQLIDENYAALKRHAELTHEERAALDAAARLAELAGPGWLPRHYRWLDHGWRA
jgi:aryl-alcohol dehydrogenase-like predicted oxidoreductase